MSVKKTTTANQPPYAPVAIFIAKYLFRPLRRVTAGMAREHAFARLRGLLLKVMADKEGRPGRVELLSGNLRLLHGFEFNRHNEVVQPFLKKCRSYLDESKTKAIIELPSINPARDILAPAGTRYYKLFAFMIVFKHKTNDYYVMIDDWMGFYDINQRNRCPLYWQMDKKQMGKSLLVTGFGIRFYDMNVKEIPFHELYPQATHSLVIHKALPW